MKWKSSLSCWLLAFSITCMVTPLSFAKKTRDFSYEEWRTKLRQQGLFDDDFMVPMRDGVKLSTTVHKLSPFGAYPSILVRTPYGKDSEMLEELELVLFLGYALVFQDVRGRYGSEGDDMVFINDGWGELQDGYDTVEWIAQQSWSNGKVGTWGPSAMGIVQGLMAPARPPHLVCQVIGFSASEGYGQAAYQSGVFRQSLVNGWLNSIASVHLLPIMKEHPFFDAFWEQMDIESKYPEINTPALIIGGWYDCFQQGTLHDFVGRQYNGMPGALGNQKLVIGPWTHTNEWGQKQGQLTYPEDSQFDDEIDYTLDWFGYWLKDSDSTIMNEPAVRYYVMGDVTDANAPGNEWRASSHWPIVEQDAAFYLQAGGSLSRSVSEPANFELTMTPGNPVPTIGGANLEIAAGPYDQSALESRNDV
ncbi:MAG: CocE/NonD family hydrolase, partial [Candidatus Hinthialibacter sp.]